MKAYFLFTVTGPLVILTSYDVINHPELLEKLRCKGLNKFVAHEVSLDAARQKYGTHFDVVLKDPHETDDMRVLDESGERAFKNFSFRELGPPVYYDPPEPPFCPAT